MGVNEAKSLEYRAYFRTKQTRRNTSVMAPPEFRRPYFTAIPFCRLGCQVLSERIEIDTVRADTEEATEFVRSLLKALGGADFVNSAHMTAMEYGRSYLVPSGSNREDGLPAVQVVSGRDMVHSVDPYTGEIDEALRVYGPGRKNRAYYTVEKTEYFEQTEDGWRSIRSIDNPSGKVPVFPLICRGDVNNTFGRPEGKDVFKLQDAACRMATDMAIASATMAVQQRILFGVEEEDFAPKDQNGERLKDANGNPIPGPTASELYMSRLLTISDPMAKVAEFSAAQLQNFTTGLNSITRQAAAVMGVPQSVFGVASDANPASGDAQRQDDSRLIRRSEQLLRGFEPGWIDLFEFILLAEGYGGRTVTIRWVNPALPNLASRSDAVLKLASIQVDGRPLYDWEELRVMLGDSTEEIEAARERMENSNIRQIITNATPENGAT